MTKNGTVEIDPKTFEAHIKEDLPPSSGPDGSSPVETNEGRGKAGVMERPAPLPPRIGLKPDDKEAIFRMLELEEIKEQEQEREREREQANRSKQKEPENLGSGNHVGPEKPTSKPVSKGKGKEKEKEDGQAKDKAKGKGKGRKSVTWSETSQVKEFVPHETLEAKPTARLAIEPAPASSTTDGEVIPSIPFSAADQKRSSLSTGQTYEQPLAPESETETEPKERGGKEKKEIMKTMVVERPMAPPRTPGAGSGAYKQSRFRANALAKPKPSVVGASIPIPTPAPASIPAFVPTPTSTPHQAAPPILAASSTSPQEAPPVKPIVVERKMAPPTMPSSNKKSSVFSGKKKAAVSSTSAPTSATTPSPSAEKTSLPPPSPPSSLPPTVKSTVVERSIDPPTVPKPSAPGEPASRAKDDPDVHPSENPTPIPLSAPAVNSSPLPKQPSSKAQVEDLADDKEQDDSDDDDGDSDGYVEFSDVDDDGDDYEIDMDDRMMMREATVNYYRLKNLIQGRGGMDGLLDQGAGLMPAEEFVPINATVTSDLSSSELAPETYASNGTSQSKFRSSVFGPSDTSSISLPTLVPGGGAKGALQNAIRVA
ncbi:hypothetical protein [Phaffia rhodozyma]|uniref:Uncharacterized protein n=1 Tax=Phaffia rhodozyma TaxID=264483 RepID=A0A0F7SS66_PHARH|nr:hypothetical protein [Phaffia rhodozyma]